MSSLSLYANKVIRIELKEADTPKEMRQHAEHSKPVTRRADPGPEATPAPGRKPPLWPAALCCRSCQSGFWRALPGGWGLTVWEGVKGCPSHYQGPGRPAHTRA